MARFWDEKFESAGYEESWSEGESVSAPRVMNEDFSTASVTGAPPAWGSRCLQIQYASTGTSVVEHRFGSPRNIVFSRVEAIIVSESLANTNDVRILRLENNGGSPIVELFLRQQGGNLRLRSKIYHDDTANNSDSSDTNLDLDTPYRIEHNWNQTANTWAWRIDDDEQASGTITSTRTFDRILVGDEGVPNAAVILLDNIALDDAAWVGPESGGGPTDFHFLFKKRPNYWIHA
jgi:hypothetical protein